MPFSSTPSSAFNIMPSVRPQTSGIADSFRNNYKTPNLFDTIQAVRNNELDRQVKQAQIAKFLQDLQQDPVDNLLKQAQAQKILSELDPNSAQNQFERKLKLDELGIKEQNSMENSGYAPITRNQVLQMSPKNRREVLGNRLEGGVTGKYYSQDGSNSPVVFDPNNGGRFIDAEGNVLNRIGKNQKIKTAAISPETFGDRAAATASQQQKFLKEPEISDLKDIGDTASTLREVRTGLSSLGIKPSKLGGVEMETVSSNLGPISIPARFNLAGQYAKDPKYTAIKAKLERAFNKYRKIVTGAQASNQELVTLRNSFAKFTDRPEVLFENLTTLEDETNRMLGDRLNLYDAVGRDTSNIRKLYSSNNNESKDSNLSDDEAYKIYQSIVKGKS